MLFSFTLCVRSRTVRDRILKFNIWNKREKLADLYFFSFLSDLSLQCQSYAPFSTFATKPMGHCEQNIWGTTLARIMIFGVQLYIDV